MESLYDGEELVCELDASGNVVAGIVHGANGLLVYGGVGYQFDPQGNSTHLLNDNGYAVSHLAYDAWGELKWGSNPTPYGYKGQWGYYRDMETGLLLLTYRYLDPATGRFLTRDPIGVEGGVNLYAYVENGVVIGVDPAGLMLWIVPIPCNGKTPTPSPCRDVPCYKNAPLPRPPKDPPRYRRFPCPAGKWPFHGFCLGSPADCLAVFNPVIGGEAMRDLCLECCEAVGNGLGWSRGQRSDCDNACLLVGLPS